MKIEEQIKLYTVLWRETMLIYENWAQRHGFSYCELLVILSLSEAERPCIQKEICRQWQIPKQTVNTILKSFEMNKWITMESLKEDRRNREIKLTEMGEDCIKTVTDKLQKCEKAVWKKMGSIQTQALLKSTKMYNEILRQEVADENT